jgi:hypothetical protein
MGTIPGDASKPLLVQLFEAVAAVTDHHDGLTRLELEFDNGHLRCPP